MSKALELFWRRGYNGTSMDDLVRYTESSRHMIYREFGGKRQIFLACLDAYRDEIVTPAFQCVERESAEISDIEKFIEHQISLAERSRTLGVGCLFANAMTEIAPHDAEVLDRVRSHNKRLSRGFKSVLRRNVHRRSATSRVGSIDALAQLLTTSAQGIWSMSRVSPDASEMRRNARILIRLVKKEIGQ